jgi:hypothetical protein
MRRESRVKKMNKLLRRSFSQCRKEWKVMRLKPNRLNT